VDNSQYDRVTCDEEKLALRTELKLGNAKTVVYLGRLEAIKGLDYLIRAFALLKHHDAVLVIAGDGSRRQELEALARLLGVQHSTRFVGYIRPEKALAYHAIADIFVLPSVTMPTGKETWGLVVNEAMNLGVPVVATHAVGAAAGGLVQSGVNGFVVPERDSKALAEAMGRILNDDGLRAEMSRNARRIIAGWDNERLVEGFQDAIEYVLNRRRRSIRCSNICST
jgi:glycosyltransferase involved in cell wall biosynthesis